MRNIMSRNGKILTRGSLALTTPRPGPDYVVIGNQRWMNKNLAIDDGQGGIYTQTVNYGQVEVTEYYYTWDAAVRVAASIANYHLPTKAELDTLVETVGGILIAGTKLKSTYGWNDDGNGTDDYGFTALPAGQCESGYFYLLGSYAYFWTATEYSSTNAYFRLFSTSPSTESRNTNKSTGFSLRLIRDVD